MVLTEAFASGTPVVASDIAGYREVVNHGVDGLLVRAGDPAAVGEALHALAIDSKRRERMGAAARRSAERFDWPHVADEVMEAYEDAIQRASAPAPESARERFKLRAGLVPADGLPAVGPQKLESIEPPPLEEDKPPRPLVRVARKAAVFGGAVGGVGLSYLALQRVGTDRIIQSL